MACRPRLPRFAGVTRAVFAVGRKDPVEAGEIDPPSPAFSDFLGVYNIPSQEIPPAAHDSGNQECEGRRQALMRQVPLQRPGDEIHALSLSVRPV
jgi:hypothetical protein